MAITIDWEIAPGLGELAVPDRAAAQRWVEAALAGRRTDAHVDLRVVGAAEMAALNGRWREREGPTNVLSFPAELDPALGPPLLGDIALCAPVLAAEAQAQGKAEGDHWAHLIVHGVLHLVGFDHRHQAEAETMEAEERRILAACGLGDPYAARSTA